ncbi:MULTISPECIES: hypothetical protein [Bacillus cereus group]|uniref:hypothetical protein n=1 Tax=Bacillus cereus group TaxID=86661 RepID=UPI000863EBDB|nr:MULTISPECIES: hypothetical protein [Bacillus cereus group]MDH2861691.1 hypothetical protein [Bacillus cytotoxicus]MDH2869702.1 hypothetical protein [Bacillus cytotoxicus]MDH2873336.1 hypothetical protein [Bacillus cytotoxicus]MDH2877774.1 hypothetical protein [Bacillus cytotoxicus]MDH2893329.1 hypothetical protein [Bacillus cytotoxicus]
MNNEKNEVEITSMEELIRLVKKHELILKRHNRAIELLSDNKAYEAYRVLRGMEQV